MSLLSCSMSLFSLNEVLIRPLDDELSSSGERRVSVPPRKQSHVFAERVTAAVTSCHCWSLRKTAPCPRPSVGEQQTHTLHACKRTHSRVHGPACTLRAERRLKQVGVSGVNPGSAELANCASGPGSTALPFHVGSAVVVLWKHVL